MILAILVSTGIFCFLIGSIPFGIWMSTLFNKGSLDELRKNGSGNIGATNVARVYGFWPTGVLTFVLDFSKGFLCAFLFSPIGIHLILKALELGDFEAQIHAQFLNTSLPKVLPWTAGCAAVLGHCLNPWLKLRGGKGVATGFGVLAFLVPIPTLAGLITFIYFYFLNKIVSLASLAAITSIFLVYLLFFSFGKELIPGLILFFVIVLRHSDNIERLLNENEVSFKSK